MNERPDRADDSRDAHLLAALRHAPDHDLLPPHEVSARILAAARAAVQPARQAPWWQRVGAWLVQPQVAASFGTLAVASLVGLMWSTREPPVADPAPQPSVAEQVVAPSAPVPAVTAPAAEATERRRQGGELVAQTVPTPPTPKPAAAPQRAREAKAPPVTADPQPATASPAEAPAGSEAGGRVATTNVAGGSAVAAPVAAPPAARQEQAQEAEAAVTSDSAVTAKASRPRGDAASMPALESLSRQTLAAARNAAAATDPLARLDPLLAGGDGAWSSGGRALPHGPAPAAWWTQLRQSTAGAWQPVPLTPADAAALASPLTLLVAGQAAGSIGFAADSVWWCPADRSACWRAPISAALREAWIAEIARW
jgi:hypothetical protein